MKQLLLRGALVSLLLASLALPASALPRERDKWLRVETDHFVFFSNADEPSIRRLATKIERLHALLSQINPGKELGSDRPIYLYAFESNRSWNPYKPLYNGKPANIAGYFFARPEASYMVMLAEGEEGERILFHEYMHYALGRIYTTVPLWFNEGMAELYSTFQATDWDAEVGHPIGVHIDTLRRHDLIPLERLFAIDSTSTEYNEERRQGIFYAESWALVHYLLRGNPARREQTFQFFKDVTNGKPSLEAFRSAFQEDAAQIERELHDYVRRSEFKYVMIPMKRAAELRIRIEPLPREETLTRLGELLLFQQDNTRLVEAEEHFRAALEAKPGYGPAQVGLRCIDEAAGRTAAVLACLEKAAQE